VLHDPRSLEHFLGLMEKLFMRLEAIRQTIGLDASTLGEEAAPKDFSVQEALARGDETVLESLAREIEQFTTDPMETLARIIDERGLDWVKSLPNGIGAIKDGERDALFALFTDGSDYYWRMKYFDGKGEMVSSANEILGTLMTGDLDSRGEMIPYEILIDRMKAIKEETLKEIEERRRRALTLEGTPAKVTKEIAEIYEALAQLGDEGEALAAKFRSMANKSALVKELQKARKNGMLLKRAKELLEGRGENSSDQGVNAEPPRLKRVCWCWVRPIHKGASATQGSS